MKHPKESENKIKTDLTGRSFKKLTQKVLLKMYRNALFPYYQKKNSPTIIGFLMIMFFLCLKQLHYHEMSCVSQIYTDVQIICAVQKKAKKLWIGENICGRSAAKSTAEEGAGEEGNLKIIQKLWKWPTQNGNSKTQNPFEKWLWTRDLPSHRRYVGQVVAAADVRWLESGYIPPEVRLL